MNLTEAQTNNNSLPVQNSRLLVFIIALSFSTVFIGLIMDNEIFSKVMYYIQYKSLPPFNEVYPYQLLLTMLFAFGLPLGMVLSFILVIKTVNDRSKYNKRLIFSSIGILSIVLFTPAVLGREMNNSVFIIGGFCILISFIMTFWFTSNYRFKLERQIRGALDLKLLGYLCFGIVTWHVCSFAAAPSFAIFPEKMIELEIRPFAVGQLKSIMVYFAAGWIFTATGFYKSMKHTQSIKNQSANN